MYYIILLFFIYSVIGWIGEVIFCLPFTKKITNRGFAFGPICPIYGFGALFIIYGLNNYLQYPFLIFVFGMLGASIIEYLTSLIMELVFKVRWWDYSKYKYHLHGRVCLLNSLIFGLGSLVITYLIHPLIARLLGFISPMTTMIASIALLVFYLIDFTLSVISAFYFKKLYTKNKITNISLLRDDLSNNYHHFPTVYIFDHFTNNYPNIKSL